MSKKHVSYTNKGRILQRRVFRRILLVATIVVVAFYFAYTRYFRSLFPRDLILSYPLQSRLVARRYVMFTTPVDSGEWPALFDTKDKLTFVKNRTTNVQVYSGIARRVQQKPSIPSEHFIFAMATDSTHIMSTDFYPKRYLAGTDSTLMLVLGPLDPLETQTVQDHLVQVGLKAYVIKVPEDNLEKRKLELLGSLAEFRKYDEGQAKYYTIIDHDVLIPDVRIFQNLLAQYNSVEAHLIADDSFKSGETYSPITLTTTLLDRMVDRDEIWMKCLRASDSLSTGVEMISSCAAIAQGLASGKAKFDAESLIMREVNGSAMGLLEAGHLPLSFRPYNIGVPSVPNRDLFEQIYTGQGPLNSSELLARYAFYEDDLIKWVYTHGCSMVHYPQGITEKELKMIEVTWNRTPDETPAHDAPYYRAKAPESNKISYQLHSATPHLAKTLKQGSNEDLRWDSILYRNSKHGDVQIDWVSSP